MPKVKIRSITPLNHNVFEYVTGKPEGYHFRPGQATELSIMKDEWKDEKRPFTFTSLPSEDHLQFTIKSYPDHNGVTERLSQLMVGDELEIGDAWGAIEYKGPGVFIAGGAGLTPFLAILRMLRDDPEATDVNTLFFANKTERDIFADMDLQSMPRLAVHHVLSEEEKAPYMHGIIDKDFLASNVDNFSQHFYVCGPDQMVEDISKALKELGAEPDGIVFEE